MMRRNKFPKISIITPTFNQADFIERTVQSVLTQNYSNLEYIVVDGGSEDGTLKLLRNYKDQIILISEKDRGQADAINKGLKLATGEIIAYLNSDDVYENDTFRKVSQVFIQNPDVYWLTGKCRIIDENDREIRRVITGYKNFWLNLYNYHSLLVLNYISQPSTFWRKSVIDKFGLFDERLHYVMDYDYWLKVGKKYPPFIINEYLAQYRVQHQSKSVTGFQKQFQEEYRVTQKYTTRKTLLFLHRLHYYLFILGPYTLLT